jgi:hypothetical protein
VSGEGVSPDCFLLQAIVMAKTTESKNAERSMMRFLESEKRAPVDENKRRTTADE